MKFSTRYLSVLLCLVLLLGGFSLNVSAKDTIDSSSMKVNILVYEYYLDSSFSQLNANNNQSVIQEGQKTLSTSVSNVALMYRLTFVNTDGKPLFKKGETYNFSANNLEFDHGLMYLVETKPLYLSHGVSYDSNSNLTYFNKNDISLTKDSSSSKYRLELTNFTPDTDIYRMAFYLRVDVARSGSVAPALCPIYGGDPFVFTVEQRSEEAGLLSGLIGWITNIFNKIGDIFNSIKSGFSDMASGFTNIINSLLELPSKLWELISNGLKALFVPSEQYLVKFKDDFDTLMGQRFGALYEASEIIIDFVNMLFDYDGGGQGLLEIPEVSYTFSGTEFTFGGQQVRIIPSGFEWLCDICRTLSAVVCTFLFINGIRKRYDDVMGVKE